MGEFEFASLICNHFLRQNFCRCEVFLGKMSVCYPSSAGESIDFASPLLVYTEKVQTEAICAKQLSMITPLHMLLFGASRVEAFGAYAVRIDDMINLDMSTRSAALICALRPCLESLVVRATADPASVLRRRSSMDRELETLVRALCAEKAWHGEPTASDSDLTPTASHYLSSYQQRNRGGGANESGAYLSQHNRGK